MDDPISAWRPKAEVTQSTGSLSSPDDAHLESDWREELDRERIQAYRADLAEWFADLFEADIQEHNFIDRIANGKWLCILTQRVASAHKLLRDKGDTTVGATPAAITRVKDAADGTFVARDNVCAFITWTRLFGVKDSLTFETDDLVLRQNEKHVLFCLMEVARHTRGLKVPQLVEMEREIDQEVSQSQPAESNPPPPRNSTRARKQQEPLKASSKAPSKAHATPKNKRRKKGSGQSGSPGPKRKDAIDCAVQRVVGESEPCLQLIRVAPGRYRLGDSDKQIFVRILRSHVVVRVGGGWDSLKNYLLTRRGKHSQPILNARRPSETISMLQQAAFEHQDAEEGSTTPLPKGDSKDMLLKMKVSQLVALDEPGKSGGAVTGKASKASRQSRSRSSASVGTGEASPPGERRRSSGTISVTKLLAAGPRPQPKPVTPASTSASAFSSTSASLAPGAEPRTSRPLPSRLPVPSPAKAQSRSSPLLRSNQT